MAIGLYDEALVNKIKSWDKGNNLHILKPNEVSRLFQMKADEFKDEPLTLPMISISRDTEINILNTNKQPMSFDGMNLKLVDSCGNQIVTDKAMKLDAIPISLSYQLDIYTRKIKEADEYLRNFVFNFINYPNIKVEIPYNDCNIIHESTVYLNNVISDNSDIPQKLFPDQFTRYTLKLVIDNAYLFSVPIKENVNIEEGELIIKEHK